MSEPIRVLHVIGIMDRGGAESMIMNLYRNIDREKVQFDFVENSFAPAAYDDEILSLGGKIYRCPHFVGKNYLQYRRWWERFFREHKGEYHIIHGHIGSCATIYLHVAKKHGLYTIAHSHSSFQSWKYKMAAYGTRFIADFFFGCSQEALADRYGKRIANSKKSKVLSNAINTEEFAYNSEIRKTVRAELGLEKAFVIGHVARFDPAKNHVFLLDFFREYCKSHYSAKLVLVGEGEIRETIMQKAADCGIGDRCIFTGARDDVNRLVQAMDVMMLPSFYEGLGICLIEGQTSGLPCVMSDGIPDEAIIIQELCKKISLNAPMKQWIDAVEEAACIERKNYTSQVVAAGYDVKSTAEWLQQFYTSI